MPTPSFIIDSKAMRRIGELKSKPSQFSASGSKRLSCAFDGTLTEPRKLNMDISQPLGGAIAFLQDCVDAGYLVIICTSRPGATVSHWLKKNVDPDWLNKHPDGLQAVQISPSHLSPPSPTCQEKQIVLYCSLANIPPSK